MAGNRKSKKNPMYKNVQQRAIHRQTYGIEARSAATLGSFFGNLAIHESAQLIGNSMAQQKIVTVALRYTNGGIGNINLSPDPFDGNYIHIRSNVKNVAIARNNVGQLCNLPVLCLFISYNENDNSEVCPYACAYKIPKHLHKMFRRTSNIKAFTDAYIKAVTDGLGITDLLLFDINYQLT
jgi:hypothetical protein